jgi:transglutaminase-like putative cysteine protease
MSTGAVELEVTHETHYAYSAPVSLAHHLAHLQPLQDGTQTLLSHALLIQPAPAQHQDSVDAFGNAQRHFSLAQPHAQLTVRSTSRVRLRARHADLDAGASPLCGDVAGRLRYVAGAHFEPVVEFVQPSPYVPRLPALRELGVGLFGPQQPVADAAVALMQRIHSGFAYQSASTDIDTPLSQVLLQKRGVCQDFAHLMAGVLRLHGLPARYVSGYLLTHPPEGGAPLQGADASHAWVQVWCPGTPGVGADGWLDLDPTNNVVPGTGHVRVAVGRDFGDVTPLRGVIRGGGGHHALSVGVSTRRVDTPDPAAEAVLGTGLARA